MGSRAARIAFGIALAALLLLPGAAVASAPPARRVVVVLVPYLTWPDVSSGDMPVTRRLADDSMLANVSLRSGASAGGVLSVGRACLGLSAGAPVAWDEEAYSAYSVDETVGVTDAADAYQQLRGRAAGAARVVYLGQSQEAIANAQQTLTGRLGALGQAVRDAGGAAAAIGCSDLGMDASGPDRSRPAGIVAADESGRVAAGDVSTRLLDRDRHAPFGVRTDLGEVLSAYDTAVAGPTSPQLVVVDPGDTARAYALSSRASSEAAAIHRSEALRAADAVVGHVARGLTPDDLLVIVAPSAPETEGVPAGFAPLLVNGRGHAGLAWAPSTRRAGMATVMDVSATVLDAMGIATPAEMAGSVLSGRAAGSAEQRMASLTALSASTVAVETIRLGVANGYITLVVLALLAAALFVYGRRHDRVSAVSRVLAAVLVACVLVPVAGLLQFAAYPLPMSVAGVLAPLAFVTAVLVWAALRFARGRSGAWALFGAAAVTSLVLLVEQWAGAPLSVRSVFSYTALMGARFYGMGNEMAGLFLGAVLTTVALALDLFCDAPWGPSLRRWGIPLIWLATVGTAAAPMAGANVGAAVWMTVAFGVFWLLLNGYRVWTWRNVFAVLVVIALLVGALVAIDLSQGSGVTHLGRAVGSAEQSGIGALWSIVARKAETNVRVLGRTNWTWLLVAVLLLLGYARWRPNGEFAELLEGWPSYSAALAAALFAGVVGYFTEDSGIIIPALLMLMPGVTALLLMMERAVSSPSGEPS